MRKLKRNSSGVGILLLSLILLAACGDSTATTAPVTTAATTEAQIPVTSPAQSTTTPAAVTATTAPATTAARTVGGVVGTMTTAAQTTTAPAATTAPRTTAAPTTTAVGGLTGRIVYDTPDEQIIMINPDGSGKVELGSGTSPIFSPDGKRIAYLERGLDANDPFKWVVVTVDLKGAGKQVLCTDSRPTTSYNLIRWSPDGQNIALNLHYNSVGRISLCNVAKPGKLIDLTTQQGAASRVYDWSPDGKKAVWQVGNQSFEYELYTGDAGQGAKGTAFTKSQNIRDEVGFKYYTSARFSPDGKTIAVAGSKVFFMSAPGQKSPLNGKVLEGLSNPGRLAWSPDGRAILVSDVSDDTLQLKLVDLATGKITVLAEDIAGDLDWTRQ